VREYGARKVESLGQTEHELFIRHSAYSIVHSSQVTLVVGKITVRHSVLGTHYMGVRLSWGKGKTWARFFLKTWARFFLTSCTRPSRRPHPPPGDDLLAL
jgi:hypothetical protein